jgi:hypothetical protein
MKAANMSMALVIAMCLAVPLVACGGRGEGSPPTSSLGPEEQLRQMVLQLEDLPSGVILAEERFVTNEESAAGSED